MAVRDSSRGRPYHDSRRVCNHPHLPTFDSKGGKPNFHRSRYPPPHSHPLQPQHHTLDFKTTANARSNHFCTPKCLLQPNLTRVSRQIRREALPIFYDSNWFHLEMGGCAVTTTEGYRIDTRRPGENHMWSPQRWWRAIGDENLRLIDRFSFVCQPHVSGGKQENRSIEYCRSTGVVERYVHETLPCEVRRPFDLNVGFTGSEDDDATSLERWRFDKARLEPDDLDSGGGDDDTTCLSDVVLSAAALEKLMLAWEPNDLEYVTDHTACDLDTEVGWPRTGGGEGLCSEGQCREVVKMTYAEVAWKGVRSSLV